MSDPRILLTNDDGIESPGFRAIHDAMSAVGDVVAVAPYSNQSAVGRAMSDEVTVHEYDLGYALEGTPADCVVAGLESLVPDADVVVAGVNKGANLGEYVLGRSGTISAAVEAAFFDVPAVAVSQYVAVGGPDSVAWADAATDPEDYRLACEATAHVVDDALGNGVFEAAEYLNINAPAPEDADDPEMVVTRPSELYEMTAEHDGETISLRDRVWERMRAGDLPDEGDTDRAVVARGDVSVSPLTAPHTVSTTDGLESLAASFRDRA